MPKPNTLVARSFNSETNSTNDLQGEGETLRLAAIAEDRDLTKKGMNVDSFRGKYVVGILLGDNR